MGLGSQHLGRHANSLWAIAFETLSNTLAEAQIIAQVNTPPDMRAELEVDKLSDTVTELEAEKQLNTLGDRLGEMQVDKRH